jgi:density-regulated protein
MSSSTANKNDPEGEISLGVEKLDITNSDSKHEAIEVKYCETCHFPEEYCDFSHAILFKKAQPIVEEKKEEKKESEAKTEEVKTEPTTKAEKKKAKESHILIELSKRGKKKHVTSVFNIEKFGLNLKDVAKLFSKKFACSSTVTKEDDGREGITLTGEFGYEIVDFLVEKFPTIKPEMCKVKEPKQSGGGENK